MNKCENQEKKKKKELWRQIKDSFKTRLLNDGEATERIKIRL